VARSPWREIETLIPVPGKSVFLKGGEIEEHHFDFDLHDDLPREMATLPVRATWFTDKFLEDGYWLVTAYDGGVCSVEYCNPTHWMPIPA
jgi:hypothetical protein